MNERLKQLSDIAYKNHLARNPHSSFGRRPDYEREFAELIVRECLLKVDEATDWIYEYNHNEVERQVKEHFGVK